MINKKKLVSFGLATLMLFGSASALAASSVTAAGTNPETDVNADEIAKAYAKNDDTIGWISVPDTNIEYPILYASNWYYADHNINKSDSLEGVYPFVNKLTKNVVIFGHNLRKSETGFHEMHHMQEAALGYNYCQADQCGESLGSKHDDWASENSVWDISVFGKEKWQVYAMYEVSANESITTLRNNWNYNISSNDSTVQRWIDGQVARSQIDFNVNVTSDDQLMTIVTCGTNYDSATANSRLFVFLKCVDGEIAANDEA